MKIRVYGLYNMEDSEQCEYFGSIEEIANYLGVTCNYLKIYLTRRKQGKQKYLKYKYELIELEVKDE